MNIRQISIFLENKAGQLSSICHCLADAGVNIVALSLADTNDFGIVRMIVDDYEKAKDVLAKSGKAVNVREVVAVCVPDIPGGMLKVLETLEKAEVDIEYSYAFSSGFLDKAVLVFRFSDNECAAKALIRDGFKLLTEAECLQLPR